MRRHVIITIGGVLFAAYMAVRPSSEPKREGVILSAATQEFVRTGEQPPLPGQKTVPPPVAVASSPPTQDPCQDTDVQGMLDVINTALDPQIHKKSSFDRAYKYYDGSAALESLKNAGLITCFRDNAANIQARLIRESRSNLLQSMREIIDVIKDPSASLDTRWKNLQRTDVLLDIMDRQKIEKQVLNELGFNSTVPAKEFKKMTDQVHVELGNLAVGEISKKYTIHPREGIIIGLGSIQKSSDKLAELQRYHGMIYLAHQPSIAQHAPDNVQQTFLSLSTQLTNFFRAIDNPPAPAPTPQN